VFAPATEATPAEKEDATPLDTPAEPALATSWELAYLKFPLQMRLSAAPAEKEDATLPNFFENFF
jgi:hypothetical protein